MTDVHAVYRVSHTGEYDTVCRHDAPGYRTQNLDNVTCPDCRKILNERGLL